MAGPGRAPSFAEPGELQPAREYPPIEDVSNEGLAPRDMLAFISAAVDQNGLVGHNIDGFNELADRGIDRIMTQHFNVERLLRNEREGTAEERQRTSFQVHFRFHNVVVGRPMCTKFHSGQFTELHPGHARLSGLSYSGAVTLGATVMLRAHYKDGRSEEKTAEILPFQIGAFPIMVGSSRCHTHYSTREGLKEMGEDPTDPGGYFIAKHGEYAVDQLENVRYNALHIHARMKPNEHVRAEFLSQPGGAFENSSQIIVRYMTSGQLTVEINSTKFEKVRLPFFVVYRLLGMTSDREVASTIVFDLEDQGVVTLRILEVLERAFQLADAAFAPLVGVLARETVVQVTAERIAKFITNPTAYLSNDNAIQYLNKDLLRSLDLLLLPHMGQTDAARQRKLRFLGLLIHKALLVHLKVYPPTDRDSYRNKRVHGAGVSLAKAFKTQVNNSVVTPIYHAFRRELKNNAWESITEKTLVDTFRNSLATSDLNRAMEQAITDGNKTIIVRRRAATNRVSSQALERKNILNTFSALRMVVTQNAGNASKQTERADMMRRVHHTYTGFICVAQSNDTGETVGMRKQLALTAGVCTAGDALPLRARLLGDPAVTPLDELAGAAMLRRALARVFVNGEWIGCCENALALVGRYRALRREGRAVDPFTTIYWDPILDEVEFWLDVGRLRRPLLIVDSNIAAYDVARAAGGEPVFVQNVRFTPAHVREIVAGRLTLAELVREGVAEYITPEEQENCLVAESIAVLREHRHDVACQYSHCDVEQAIFGLAAHISPFANHTQPARVTLETNQARQTGGWYALNFPWRVDKVRFFQFYNETPLVSTITHKFLPSNGVNVVIAYASYGGDNQEDSAIVCQASADRGLFAGAFFRYELGELEKGESFGVPLLTTRNLKPNACYEKLDGGFVRVGSVVRYGDVLIGRVAKLARREADERAGGAPAFLYTDRSIVYRTHEPAVVEAVLKPRGANDEPFAVVKLRYERPIRTGDKLCLTPDHDVLTESGWKAIAAVTIADRVATLVGDSLRYDTPLAVHAFEVNEDLYEISTQMVSLCTTLNHRMYVKPRGGKFGFTEARHLMGRRVSYKRDAVNQQADAPAFVRGGAAGEPDLVVPMEAWLAILGAFISDGWVDKRNTPQIRRALAPLSVGALAKRLPAYVWRLSQKQARILIDALVQEDGRRGPTVMYYTSSAGLANDVQRLALHAGWSANIAVHTPAGATAQVADGRVVVAHAINWQVAIIRSKNQPTVNHGHVHTQNAQIERTLAYAGSVHCLTMPAGTFYVRRGGRPVWTGNSSRSGNKCIIASVMPQSDMPFTEAGITPDLIVNTHSIPSRMTLGQLIEGSLGKACARRGAVADGTAFLPVDHHAIAAELREVGFRFNGRERMYNGKTGEYFDAAIFIAPTMQQRLQKFVLDDEQSVAGVGPTDATTGQPLGGKHVQGGLRIGEMERWGLEAHGAMINLHEKSHTDSDGREMFVCRGCGALAVYNEHHSIYWCRTCGEGADIAVVESTKTAILLHEELAAANISVRLGLRPRAFEADSR